MLAEIEQSFLKTGETQRELGRAMVDIAQWLSKCDRGQRSYADLHHIVSSLLYPAAMFMVLRESDGSNTRLVYAAKSGQVEPGTQHSQKDIDDADTLAAFSIARKEAYFADYKSIQQDLQAHQYQLNNTDIKSWISVPIFIQGVCRGVVGLYSEDELIEFSQPDIEILQLVAALVGPKLGNSHSESGLFNPHSFDPLSRLPTEQTFYRLLEPKFRSENDGPLALMLIELAYGRLVSHILSATQIDVLVVKIKDRLQQMFQDQQLARIEKVGYAVAFNQTYIESNNFDGLASIADAVIRLLAKPFDLNGQKVFVTSRIGVSQQNQDCASIKDLRAQAERSLERAKQSRHEPYKIQEKETDSMADVEKRIANAFMSTGFTFEQVYCTYQPIIDLTTKKPVAMEVLARWQDDSNEHMDPACMIETIEYFGLINKLSLRTLDHALAAYKYWMQHEAISKNLRLNYNMSASQISSKETFELVNTLLQKYNLSFECLAIEIVETQRVRDIHQSQEVIQRFVKAGARILIDDFGAGYSWLEQLERLPVAGIKVDKSVVHRLGENIASNATVRVASLIAKDLGAYLVGEGIESDEQLAELKAQGVDYGQGFFFAEPMNNAQATTYLVNAA